MKQHNLCKRQSKLLFGSQDSVLLLFCASNLVHFFDTAPSYEAWETHRYLKNRLSIVRARGGRLLDHPLPHVTYHQFPLRKIIW